MIRLMNIPNLFDRTEVAAALRFGQARALPVGFLGRMVEPMQRVWRRHAVYNELMALDDRMLADIGLRRDVVAEAAEIAAAMPMPPGVGARKRPGALSLITNALVRPVILWLRRSAAHDQLSRLDDRLLRDIGVDRGQIGTIVDRVQSSTLVNIPASADFAEMIDAAVLEPIRQWNRTRQTARSLSRLDDRQLADVGLLRSDIGWVSAELAVRPNACANGNDQPRAA
jgi:uncharacterized protein YjiS (DUF1127 family)